MKMKIDKKSVGLRIRQIRMNKGYTLEEFGKLFTADKSSVLGWENGRSLPNKERIKQISKIADITVNELLYGSIEEFITNNIAEMVKEKSEEFYNLHFRYQKQETMILHYVHSLESIYNITSVQNIDNLLLCLEKIIDTQIDTRNKLSITALKEYNSKKIAVENLLNLFSGIQGYNVLDDVLKVLKANIYRLEGFRKDIAMKEFERVSTSEESSDDY